MPRSFPWEPLSDLNYRGASRGKIWASVDDDYNSWLDIYNTYGEYCQAAVIDAVIEAMRDWVIEILSDRYMSLVPVVFISLRRSIL